jgi:hypothetical protein
VIVANCRAWPSIAAITPTMCEVMRIAPPALCSSAPLDAVVRAAREAFNGSATEKCLIFAPDAIGSHLFDEHPSLRERIAAAAPVAVSLRSVVPPITPVAFASMFTGAEPAEHGIRESIRPVLGCDTLFDALVRAGKRVAIVAVEGSSIDRMYRERGLDHFAEDYDPQVTARAISLLEADEHDLIVAYHQEYDDTMHRHGPFAPEAVQAARNNVESFVEIAQAFDTHWRAYNRVLAFTPDHGAHANPERGGGTHGDDIADDMEITHFFGLRVGE